MNSSHLAGSRTKAAMLLLASAAIATTGCSNMTSTATGGASAVAAMKIPGKIHGGNQPVSGATVNLYFAGQSGIGVSTNVGAPTKVPRLVATTTSAADGAGSFSFTLTPGAPNDGSSASFSCPTDNSNPYIYVVAKGGTTVNTASATPNAAAEFIAPVGRCADINASTVYMSEVVTVATVAAIHQYMNSSAGLPIEQTIGSDGIYVSDLGLGTSFGNVANMANLSTGLGNPSITRAGSTSVPGTSMTITPELAKINQLANIISACINQQGGDPSGSCQAIYTNAAVPPKASTTSVGAVGTTATDLLTALYYIFTNPTNSGTAARTALFNLSPANGAPYQPTLTAVPTDWSIGISFTASGNCAGSSAPFLGSPVSLAFGANGNIFATNGQTGAGSVVQISPTGAPIACLPVTSGGTGTAAAGIAFDIANGVWSGSSTANVLYRFIGSVNSSLSNLTYTTAAPVTSITTDGYGDVFFAATDGNLYEIPLASAATAATTPVLINSIPLGASSIISIDAGNRIWATSGTNSITYTQGTVTGGSLTFASNATTAVTTTSASFGLATTSSTGDGVFYSTTGASPSITSLMNSSGSYAATTGYPVSGGGLSSPSAIALDGAQNVWAANGGTGGLSAFDREGVALAPAGFQKDASFLGPQSSILIDTSGNIWVGLTGSSTITEIVGAAVPVYQPYSSALQTNRFQQIP